ncbi:MAG: fasciclin domain-containing protein [Bacteroidia bacterium]|nr:fasciclin domain-containing protein [Bacteroidia bacterium]
MKKNIFSVFGVALAISSITLLSSCGDGSAPEAEGTATESAEENAMTGQSGVQDDESMKDIVKVAVGSKDHTTLVAALQAAEYVDVLANAGPFTVFAPTNDAFAKLPAGTVENLVKPENKATLRDILEYHVAVAVYKPEMLRDGQVINMANMGNITINVKDGKITVNGKANVIATVYASNGVIHVVDNVLLEEKKK